MLGMDACSVGEGAVLGGEEATIQPARALPNFLCYPHSGGFDPA